MRDHGRIACAYWTSKDIQPLPNEPKLLGAYLLSCSHGTIAGVFRLSIGYVADDLRWTSETVSEGFRQLSQCGFINRCEASHWVWIRKYLEWNPPENPNQWKAIRKVVAQLPDDASWRVDFVEYLARLSGEKATPIQNPSERVTSTVSKSGSGIGVGTGERGGTPAPDFADAPRGPGVIPAGNKLTTLSPADVYNTLLEDWRRDVPEANPDAFAQWIVHLEGLGRQMTSSMRLAQARRLAGNGDFDIQAEVVSFCTENGFKSLIPIADVRARTQGMARNGSKVRPTAPSDAERLRKLKDNRAACVWLKGFRDPSPNETADQYLAAQEAEFKSWQLRNRDNPAFARELAASKTLPSAKRVA